MEAKTLPADVCVFGCFGRLSSAAVHSVDNQFYSGRKWSIHFSSIVPYLRKNSFVLRWNSCKQRSDGLWANAAPTFIHLSHWQMFIQNSDYTTFWYLQFLYYLTQLQFTIEQNEFVEFFGVFQDNCRIWVTWAFTIICVCTTAFKVSIPPLHHCFRWSRVWIILIKPLFCLNSIFPIKKQCFINTGNSDFPIVLKNNNSSFTWITVICKLIIWLGSNFNTCHLKVCPL